LFEVELNWHTKFITLITLKALVQGPVLIYVCKARVFVPLKLFQPNLMFVGKAGTYHEAPEKCSTLEQTLALPTQIRLGWKGLPRSSTLA
jgi:hypothetical protein